MPVKKDIIFPIFLKCLEFTKDKFWYNLFEDFSYNIVPQGCYFNKTTFCCNIKGRDFSYKMDKYPEPEQLYNDIKSLLIDKLGILSTTDKQKNKIDFTQIEENLTRELNQNWTSIRKKNIKDLIIENYVIEMKNLHNLDVKHAKKLLTTITLGLMFKTISNNDIKYKNGKILSVDGITFENRKVIIKCDIYDINIENIPIIRKKLSMSDNWIKFIENLQKLEELTDKIL